MGTSEASTEDATLQEMIAMLANLICRPAMFWGEPGPAEGAIVMLVSSIVALEQRQGFFNACTVVQKECRNLTRDVPRHSNMIVALCQEAALPESITSFECLSSRAETLARHLIKRWPVQALAGSGRPINESYNK